MKKLYCVIESFKNLKSHTHKKKPSFFPLFAVSARIKIKNYFKKKKNQLRN